MIWRVRQRVFEFPRPAIVMGILNVTPDSFSDGGRHADLGQALAHAQEMVAAGAEIIDVGGESTRPGAADVPEAEEIRRVVPVIERLARETTAVISVDTRKPGVARAALQAGAHLVNDVAANRPDDALWREVAAAGAGYVAMHMQGTPQTMQHNPTYVDVVGEVQAFFADRLARLAAAGVAPEQVVLDPGIGFGKTLEHNLRLLGGLGRCREHGRPVLLGVSRKSFIGHLLGLDVAQRLPAALACTCDARAQGVELFRTHDVAATVQALRMSEAIAGRRP